MLAAFLAASAGCLLLAAPSSARRGNAVTDVGKPLDRSLVPRWDVRGPCRIPWQGIACADMTEDGRWVALGTIAPPGDPHAFLLDDRGRVIDQRRIGERWVEAVAVGAGGGFWAACSAVPAGTAGDKPLVKVFSGGEELGFQIDTPGLQPESGLFHYGDHSNHYPQVFRAAGQRLAIATPNRAFYAPVDPEAIRLAAGKQKGAPSLGSYGKVGPATVTTFAVAGGGRAVVGLAVREYQRTAQSRNLVVVDMGKPSPLWARPVCEDVEKPPALEKGVYGPNVPPYKDSPVWAPLAVAVDSTGGLIASADYQGWNRCFGSLDYGMRFVPTRPTIHIHNAAGDEVRRFGPETFGEAFWCDLAFSADGGKLLAFGHNWTSRGLAALGFLPADEKARSLYSLNVRTGEVGVIRFPDAIASLAVAGGGKVVVGCWDHRVYVLDADLRPVQAAPLGVDVGAPALVRASRDGERILAAGADGVVRMLDADAGELWRTDLNESAAHGDKPWTRNQRLTRASGAEKDLAKAAEGLWRVQGGRTHSDLGNLYVIEAPEGLLLIEANAGLSIEQTWAQMVGVGLDPTRVRYVLLTHEHGDHAPGAYLWRLLTGAKVLATPEVAYALAHHTPIGVGYGFHPPQPVDVVVDGDRELTLAGLTLKAVRTPGHTAGSLGFAIRRGGKTFVAIGDLIMPGGQLGYSGSLSFSAQDVLESLRKVDGLRPDYVWGGHGAGEPGSFIASGIAAGEATGWSRMPPVKPDRYHRLTPGRYLVVGWLERIVSAAYGDVNGDRLPDLAVLTGGRGSAAIKVYLNRKGSFGENADKADLVRQLPGFSADQGARIQIVRISGGRMADVFVASETQAAVLLSEGGGFASRAVDLPVRFAVQPFVGDFNGDGRMDLLIGQRFVGRFTLAIADEGGGFRLVESKGRLAQYHNAELADVSGDGRADLVTSGGDIFLRRDDGSLPDEPSIHLNVSAGKDWVGLAAADFTGDGAVDLAFAANRDRSLAFWVFQNAGTPQRPFRDKPVTFEVPGLSICKDGPTVADWNGDGVADLIVRTEKGAAVLLGSGSGLDPKQVVQVDLDYRPLGDSRFAVADFGGSGRADLAAAGASSVGAIAVYVYLHP